MSSDTAPSRQRLTRKGEATRRRIVDAAAELIHEQGVAHTTVEEVRDAASASNSQLYHYFDDKPALVRAVIERQADMILQNQERFDLASLDGLREWRDYVVENAREASGSRGCPIGSLGAEVAETEPEARAIVAASFNRWETRIRADLLKMQAMGRLRPDADPHELAVAMLAALQGGLLLAQVHRDPEPLAIALDAMLGVIASQQQRR